MARRKRKHIPMIQIAASALADKLPPRDRDAARDAKLSAAAIVRMFTPDHVRLHSWGGSDKWHNITMTLRGEFLKAKDAADTSRAAKAVRIDEKWRPFTRAMAAGKKPPKRVSRWPKRKMGKRK